jgi:hypothetical protein
MDFLVEDHGSIMILQPLSAEAKVWAEENLGEAMRWGGGVVIEPRYLPPIIDGILGEGMTVG